MKFVCYPIPVLANGWNGPRFDASNLPLHIVDDIYLEDVSNLLTESTFGPIEREFGRSDSETLRSFRYALIDRYQASSIRSTNAEAEADNYREQKLERVMACLRLIRPMQESLGPMRGVIDNGGALEVKQFSRPYHLNNSSEIEKLFAVRDEDAVKLREVAPAMIRAMEGEFWKFRMAVHFYTDGFFSSQSWKTRFYYRCTALESLFSSKKHRGTAISKARITDFLGKNTAIYEGGDIPDWLPQAEDITIEKVLPPLYEARNTIAHGDRLDDSFFSDQWRLGLNGALVKYEVLDEAACALVRKSLLKILSDDLLAHFMSSKSADHYFQ